MDNAKQVILADVRDLVARLSMMSLEEDEAIAAEFTDELMQDLTPYLKGQ